jgi:uncharacterized protein YecT (DUF1311 family)
MILWAAPAAAQEVDCTNVVTQQDMNTCAYDDWQYADGELNDAYAAAITLAQEMAEYSDTDVEEALRVAQRAWVTYRDAACLVESLSAEGGSMQPMLEYGCMARLTEERAEDLRLFVAY